MSVTMTAAATPMLKNNVIGSRYTKEGRVCRRSRMGVMTLVARLLRPIQMPTGMPIARQMPTAMNVTMRVSMLSAQ
jgi:hypothetical protein